jgi:hypothetical protein
MFGLHKLILIKPLHSDNVCDSYWEVRGSNPDPRPAILTEIFHVISQTLRTNAFRSPSCLSTLINKMH